MDLVDRRDGRRARCRAGIRAREMLGHRRGAPPPRRRLARAGRAAVWASTHGLDPNDTPTLGATRPVLRRRRPATPTPRSAPTVTCSRRGSTSGGAAARPTSGDGPNWPRGVRSADRTDRRARRSTGGRRDRAVRIDGGTPVHRDGQRRAALRRARGRADHLLVHRTAVQRDAADELRLAEERDQLVLRHLPASLADGVDLRNPANVKSLLRRAGIEVADTRAWRLEELRGDARDRRRTARPGARPSASARHSGTDGSISTSTPRLGSEVAGPGPTAPRAG